MLERQQFSFHLACTPKMVRRPITRRKGKPRCIVIAGSNGAGKTTFAMELPRRRPRRRIANSRPRPLPATGAGYLWAYDFVFDACANGQQLKCLTVIDEYTRECLAIDVAGSIRSSRVIEVLSKLVSVHGAPRYLRNDTTPRDGQFCIGRCDDRGGCRIRR